MDDALFFLFLYLVESGKLQKGKRILFCDNILTDELRMKTYICIIENFIGCERVPTAIIDKEEIPAFYGVRLIVDVLDFFPGEDINDFEKSCVCSPIRRCSSVRKMDSLDSFPISTSLLYSFKVVHLSS